MEKHELKVSITDKNGIVIDMFSVFTTDKTKSVEQIVNSIENSQWTDEEDFDEYLAEISR